MQGGIRLECVPATGPQAPEPEQANVDGDSAFSTASHHKHLLICVGPVRNMHSTSMHSRTSSSLVYLILLCGFLGYVHARHVHHKPLHQHFERAEALSPSATGHPSPTSSALANHTGIQAIKHEADELSQDILQIQHRVQEMEAQLAGLLSSSSSSRPTSATSSGTIHKTSSSIRSTTTTASATSTRPSSVRTATSTVHSHSSTTATHWNPVQLSHEERTAYVFRPNAKDNVAVYYGQSANTTAGGLAALCQNSNVDIVILAFVNNFFAGNGYPAVDFGPACDPPNEQQSAKAPSLRSCPRLATEIKTCQHIGKLVLVSLGGYIANTSFASNAEATKFAGTLWNLFGAGNETTGLRPFGPNVTIDGFDIDNENHHKTYYNTFVTALRSHMTHDTKKKYYISAAPQCPIPDESTPLQLLHQADFVFVQFYNNPSCNINSPGFQASVQAWSKLLANSTAEHKPRLYIGAGAAEAAGSGYVHGEKLKEHTDEVRSAQVKNLGGVMLWDGTMAMENLDSRGLGYLHYAKAAMG
ncbi:hypothetical protein LTR74_010222 [Friedmanniomyces endolithicus]|nr:hypothetical protein LTR74_010222 [Friedmanniomyces endolithicus]